MGAKRLIKRVSEQEMVCGKYESFDFKKLTTADQLNGIGSGRPRSLRTADNVSMSQDMICSYDDAPCSHINLVKYKNILNTATSLEYFLLSALQLLLWLLTDHNVN